MYNPLIDTGRPAIDNNPLIDTGRQAIYMYIYNWQYGDRQI